MSFGRDIAQGSAMETAKRLSKIAALLVGASVFVTATVAVIIYVAFG